MGGEALWRDDGGVVAACAGESAEAPRGRACAELIARSDRARAQWTFEVALRRFEARW